MNDYYWFLYNIFLNVKHLFGLFQMVLSNLMNNFIFKTILYIIILIFIIELAFEIYKIVLKILDFKNKKNMKNNNEVE